MNPANMERIIEGKRYSVATAELLADDTYWDGLKTSCPKFLYRTPNGAYFTLTMSQWQEEPDYLTAIDLEDAIELYEGPLTEHYIEYADAFPGVEDA